MFAKHFMLQFLKKEELFAKHFSLQFPKKKELFAKHFSRISIATGSL